MSETAEQLIELRSMIISEPEVILEDRDIMHALIAANEKALGGNIVDLRGVAMERLEARFDRLEDTHRSVIAAAYENLAGTNQIHRAVLAMLEPSDFEGFIRVLSTEVCHILRVDCLRLVLESGQEERSNAAIEKLGEVLHIASPGFVDDYLTMGRERPVRHIILRQARPRFSVIYGEVAPNIHSEACLKLDLGEGRLPGLLVMGAEDPHQFRPSQGTDLLAFFASVFERQMWRWLG